MNKVKPGIYQHYKGGKYNVLFCALHSEDGSEYVVYEMLYDSEDFPKGTAWIRPKAMFLENVVVSGAKKPRFKYIGK